MKTYEYSSLQSNQIRIFNLLPGRVYDRIAGTLETHDFDTEQESHAPDYVALSYSWGPTHADGSHLTHTIRCDGRAIAVTANLHQALKRLREIQYRSAKAKENLTEKVRTNVPAPARHIMRLWIDYLCINQEDLDERSEQVAKRAVIYRVAERVVVWLGEPKKGSVGRAEIKLMKSLSASAGMQADQGTDGFKSIAGRAWFTRRWCVQEVASREQTYSIMLGNKTCDQDKFCRGGFTGSIAPHFEQEKQVQSLVQSLHSFASTECADPRDRIYALRGVAYDGLSVHVDYKLDVRDLYLHTALVIAFNESRDPREIRVRGMSISDDTSLIVFARVRPMQLLRLLVLASLQKSTIPRLSKLAGLETWYPDWSCPILPRGGLRDGADRWGGGSRRMLLDDWSRTPDLPTLPTFPSGRFISDMMRQDLPFERNIIRENLPSSMQVTAGGHCYLRVKATVLRQTRSLGRPRCSLGTVWCATRPTESESQVIFFWLLPSYSDKGGLRHSNLPIYRLHTMVQDWNLLNNPVVDLRFSDLAGYQMIHDYEFYLE